jgi:hypothetical protein
MFYGIPLIRIIFWELALLPRLMYDFLKIALSFRKNRSKHYNLEHRYVTEILAAIYLPALLILLLPTLSYRQPYGAHVLAWL